MTEFPADPIADLTKRIEDLEGVVKHMVTALTGFAEIYRQPKEAKPTEEPTVIVSHWFLAIPTSSGLYLDSYMGRNPSIDVVVQFDNALIVCLRGAELSIAYQVHQDSWLIIKQQDREYSTATPGLMQRAQQLVEEYENTKSSE